MSKRSKDLSTKFQFLVNNWKWKNQLNVLCTKKHLKNAKFVIKMMFFSFFVFFFKFSVILKKIIHVRFFLTYRQNWIGMLKALPFHEQIYCIYNSECKGVRVYIRPLCVQLDMFSCNDICNTIIVDYVFWLFNMYIFCIYDKVYYYIILLLNDHFQCLLLCV